MSLSPRNFPRSAPALLVAPTGKEPDSRATFLGGPGVRADCQKAWRVALGIGAALWISYALSCWLRFGGEVFTKDVSNLFNTFASLVSAACCLACAGFGRSASARWRLAWALTGVGWTLNALGEAQWVLVETLQRRSVPSPGLSDVFFELSYPALLAGLACFFVGERHTKRARAVLDSALFASAFGALAWFFVLQPMWMARDVKEPVGTWIAVSYPLFDVFIGWGALALACSRIYSGPQQRAISGLAFIMGLFACSDLLYALSEVSGTYQSGGWNDVIYGTVYLLISGCALLTLWSEPNVQAPRPERENVSLWRALAPYALTISVLGVVSVQQWKEVGRLNLDVLVWGMAFLALVLMRQMLSLSENVRLARELRDLNTDLDGQVQERTRQLDALLQLSKAVNSTLLEDDVLQQAALSVCHAVHVEAAGVWLWDAGPNQISLAAFDCNESDGASHDQSKDLNALLSSESARALAHRVACGEESWGEAPLQNHVASAPGTVPWLHFQPVRFRGRVLGVLGALRLVEGRARRSPFAPDEVRLLENVGLEIGAALENARTYSRAVEAADIDPVTGLLNHRAMQVRFETAWARAQGQNAPLSVVMMDLNNFKGFNDTYGHSAGDEVLRLVAATLTKVCRAGDFVARYGGDEFFMLLPGTDGDSAMRVASRLQEAMAQIEFRPSGGHEALPVTLSFGVASSPRDARTKIELMSLADRNLYVAKGSRDQIRGTSEASRDRVGLVSNDAIGTLDAMVTAISNADSYTRQHSEDVTQYALWIGEELGLSFDTLRTIRVGGMLHDVGKICVPQDILKKPGNLSDDEFAAMRMHPALGALLVGAILPDAGVLDIVRFHHERFDGRGYPCGHKGEEIPILGRVVAIADAFSAMTTSRPYRKAMSHAQARLEIERGAGTQFDPLFCDAFLRVLDKHSDD